MAKNHLKLRFLTLKSLQMTVFCPKIRHFRKNTLYARQIIISGDDKIAEAQDFIRKHGSIVMALAIYDDFWGYTRGVYTKNPAFTAADRRGWHAVRVVGWGTDDITGLDYWLCVNSWGKTWGENGAFKIRRGVNEASCEEYGFWTIIYECPDGMEVLDHGKCSAVDNAKVGAYMSTTEKPLTTTVPSFGAVLSTTQSPWDEEDLCKTGPIVKVTNWGFDHGDYRKAIGEGDLENLSFTFCEDGVKGGINERDANKFENLKNSEWYKPGLTDLEIIDKICKMYKSATDVCIGYIIDDWPEESWRWKAPCEKKPKPWVKFKKKRILGSESHKTSSRVDILEYFYFEN